MYSEMILYVCTNIVDHLLYLHLLLAFYSKILNRFHNEYINHSVLKTNLIICEITQFVDELLIGGISEKSEK